MPEISFYADENLYNQITDIDEFYAWLKPDAKKRISTKRLHKLELLSSQSKPALIFLSDPQLKMQNGKDLADSIINDDGVVLFTGHFDDNSYGKEIMKFPNVFNLRYNVHPHVDDINDLCRKNTFRIVVPTHTAGARLNEIHTEWVQMSTGQSLVLAAEV